MQSVPSRIWTRVVVSIFYDDNHYTTGTSTGKYIIDYDYFKRKVIGILAASSWQTLEVHGSTKKYYI